MRKEADLKRQRKIGISVAFLFIFILINIFLWDFSANVTRLEQKRGQEILSDLAVQGATIIEHKIKGITSVLWSMSHALEHEEYGELISERDDVEIDYLRKTIADSNINFVRMGIVDKSGMARISDGRVADVSEKKFFQAAIRGEEYISAEVWKSSLEEADHIVVAVPVYDRHNEVKEVLYGIVHTEDLHPYNSSHWDLSNTKQYVHIIDANGNFVIRSSNPNSILTEDNLYEGITKDNSTVPVADIKAALAQQKSILTTINQGDDVRYVYLAPMAINDWCVVTVLTGDLLDEQLDNFQDLVTELMVKILLTLLLFGGFCYWLILKEKGQIEQLNHKLAIKDQIFRTAISKMGDYVFVYDIKTDTLEFVNYDAEHLPAPQVIKDFPRNFAKYVEKDSATYQEIQRLLDSPKQDNLEGEVSLEYNDTVTDYRVQLTSILDEKGKIVHLVGTLEDITDEKQKERKIQKSNQIRSAVLSDTIGFFEVDLNKDCLLLDGEPKDTPYSYSYMIEKFTEMRVHADYQQKLLDTFSIDNLLRLYESGLQDFSMEYIRLTSTGEEFWVNCETHLEKDVVTGDVIVLATLRNINEQKSSELELKKQVGLDPLTKAYNRNACVEKVNEILSTAQDSTHAFLLIDLDNFKNINDNLGHIVGDSALVDVANILKKHVRPDDIVCRLGGDEFIVFLVDMPTVAIDRNVTKMLEKLNLTYERNHQREVLSASVGIAIAPEHGSTFQTLYEKADIALYDVKRKNKNDFKVYSEK